MTFYHYANKPMTLNRRYKYQQMYDVKPDGLWLSHEDAWPKWAYENLCDEGWYTVRYRVDLHEDARILRLDSAEAVLGFTRRYGDGDPDDYVKNCRWDDVAWDYQGLVAVPYLKGTRSLKNLLWYDSFDCPCACIWDLRAIESFTVENILA